MARKKKTVTLSRSYSAHDRSFDVVTLLEPIGSDLDEIGDITEVQFSADGNPVIIYHDDRLILYRNRLMEQGEDLPSSTDIGQLELVDALKLREAVSDFFQSARAKLSPKRKTSSSSGADGSQT